MNGKIRGLNLAKFNEMIRTIDLVVCVYSFKKRFLSLLLLGHINRILGLIVSKI
ncbi:hypothetical protein LEP1GSC186_1470 [Leptospira noguchii serovar Autumnalis str. ZUN142]|uniref:Uncharacterized protein n=1 Tax=Leptospira noguchii serovar Autumnalis str. ZUN142 TaxID=1085540 RepID=M6UG40_9LEPT|nr:hypothetical protein LEP1GSC186_1470 [Leptospira noguchii serovar Autumnalis str. ZUN142]